MDKATKILTDSLHRAEQHLAFAPMDSDMLRGWAEIIKEHSEALAELQAYKAKFEELEAKYNQLTHKHDLVCHDNCRNLCWENEESYCKEEGCIRNYIDPSLYIDIYEDKYKPRELDK